MTPVALGERITSLVAVLRRAERAMQRRGPPADESAIEWQRTLAEVRMVLQQHEAFEKGPR